MALQQELANANMTKKRRCAHRLEKVGSLEIFSNVAISNFLDGRAVLNFELFYKLENSFLRA